jgi:subtilisin family serine protease
MRVIEADRAWAAGYLGSPDVRIAVIDSGVDPTHPDLAGLIDPSRSISFCPPEDALVAQEFPGYPPWTDLHSHGTWVASIAASKGVVVAGVTSRTTLMAVKLFGIVPCGGSFTVNMIRAIIYATNNGADIINGSFTGGPTPWPKAGQKGFFHYHMLAVRYALQKGVSAVVVAAGNQALDLDHQGNSFQSLCDIPGVICVSATGPTDFGPQALGPWVNPDTPGFYTNFGASAIRVAAPGGNLSFDRNGNLVGIGTLFGACPSTMRTFDAQGNLVPGICPRFGFLFADNWGTSGAAPHVSGLAALLVSRFGRGSAAQVQSVIENSADDLGKPGVDQFYGRGRINVPRALGIR